MNVPSDNERWVSLGIPQFPTTTKVGAYTVVAGDDGYLIECNGTFTLSLTAAATLGSGFSVAVDNVGAGTITVDPNGSEIIVCPGAATETDTTLTLAAGERCYLTCNGYWWTLIAWT